MTRLQRHPERAGMTLIETIAVLVILGGVAAAGLGTIGPMSAAMSRQESVAIVETFFDRARLLAMQHGGAVLTTGDSLIATSTDKSFENLQSNQHQIIRSLPSGWSCTIRLEATSQPIDSLHIRANGISEDCYITVSNNRGDSITLERLGMSGQIRIKDSEPGAAP